MTAIALDWRRPFATYDDGRVPMYCAIVEVVGGRALTACRGSMAESDGYVSATSTTTDARRCRACLRACGVPTFGVFASVDDLAASEIVRLQRKAAPAVDLEPMAGPTLPRTTAIDLPFSDISADERDDECVLCKAFGYSDHDGTMADEGEAKS